MVTFPAGLARPVLVPPRRTVELQGGPTVDAGLGVRVALRVVDLGLACCALEVDTALRVLAEVPDASPPDASPPDASPPAELLGAGSRDACDPVASPPVGSVPVELDVVVVAGTVTYRAASLVVETVRELRAELPGLVVISFGACCISGGPYWDSYAVTAGLDQLLEVDRYVPGCPPRPQALLDCLVDLARERQR